MKTRTDYLFVYGTLRKDSNNQMYKLLARYAKFVSEGYFQGKLYKISYYPGAIKSTDANDRVYGEVYELNEPESLLKKLDQYEECGEGFSTPTEYLRIRERVYLVNGEIVTPWVYIYNWPVENCELIKSGDFYK